MTVFLREITRDTVREVCKLDAGDEGRQVAPNAVSIAQAYFAPEAWSRAIHDDDPLVGFVMCSTTRRCRQRRRTADLPRD